MVKNELQDLRSLTWTRNRHSSGSAGSFLKSYEIIKGIKHYYKLSNYNYVEGIVGHECINEIVVDRLLDILGFEHLHYDLLHGVVNVNNTDYQTWLCESLDFKHKGDSKVSLDVYFEMNALPQEKPFDFCIRMGWADYIYEMLILDYIILNRDRHGGNIEILKNGIKNTIKPAPLFDHGISLVFSCHKDTDIEKYDVLEDKQVQCFVGTSSTWGNLGLIPKERLVELPSLTDKDREYLFRDLNNAVSEIWCDKVWDMINKRMEKYEDFRHKG